MPDGSHRQTGYNSAFAHDSTQAPPVIQSLAASAFLASLMAVMLSAPVQAEPRILIGPTEPEEEPEVVDTVSGLSYDQLKRLRELRKWLDQRHSKQMQNFTPALVTAASTRRRSSSERVAGFSRMMCLPAAAAATAWSACSHG